MWEVYNRASPWVKVGSQYQPNPRFPHCEDGMPTVYGSLLVRCLNRCGACCDSNDLLNVGTGATRVDRLLSMALLVDTTGDHKLTAAPCLKSIEDIHGHVNGCQGNGLVSCADNTGS